MILKKMLTFYNKTNKYIEMLKYKTYRHEVIHFKSSRPATIYDSCILNAISKSSAPLAPEEDPEIETTAISFLVDLSINLHIMSIDAFFLTTPTLNPGSIKSVFITIV